MAKLLERSFFLVPIEALGKYVMGGMVIAVWNQCVNLSNFGCVVGNFSGKPNGLQLWKDGDQVLMHKHNCQMLDQS